MLNGMYTADKVLLVFAYLFLDTQVSLAPTYVRRLVRWLVGWSVTLSDFQSLVSNGQSNKKSSNNKVIYFQILLLGGPSPPTKIYMKA